jgi:hypothetical protein
VAPDQDLKKTIHQFLVQSESIGSVRQALRVNGRQIITFEFTNSRKTRKRLASTCQKVELPFWFYRFAEYTGQNSVNCRKFYKTSYNTNPWLCYLGSGAVGGDFLPVQNEES